MPTAAMPAISWWIWTTPTGRSFPPCRPRDTSPVSCSRLAPVISRPGFVSVPPPWSPPWPPPSADNWPTLMGETWPAPIGVTWEGWLGSPTRSPYGALPLCSLGKTPAHASRLGHPRRLSGPGSPAPGDCDCGATAAPRPGRRFLLLGPLPETFCGLPDLSTLAAPLAHSTTVPTTRLEHRRQVDRQGTAALWYAPASSLCHPPTGKPWLSTPSWRPYRLLASHPGSSPPGTPPRAFSLTRSTPTPPPPPGAKASGFSLLVLPTVWTSWGNPRCRRCGC